VHCAAGYSENAMIEILQRLFQRRDVLLLCLFIELAIFWIDSIYRDIYIQAEDVPVAYQRF
jgi:hypothetical protein